MNEFKQTHAILEALRNKNLEPALRYYNYKLPKRLFVRVLKERGRGIKREKESMCVWEEAFRRVTYKTLLLTLSPFSFSSCSSIPLFQISFRWTVENRKGLLMQRSRLEFLLHRLAFIALLVRGEVDALLLLLLL